MAKKQQKTAQPPRNTLRSQPVTDEENPEPAKKRRKGKTLPGKGFAAKIITFLRDERTRKVSGVFLIFLSLFLLVAFISFFFTWKADQSEVGADMSSAEEVRNAMGLLGAKLSHLFIQRWFGFPSFLLLPAVFLLGIKLLYNKTLVRLNRAIAILFFLTVWASTLLGFTLSSVAGGILGGEFGKNMTDTLQQLAGGVGTGFILFFSFAVFLVVAFNSALKIPNPFKKKTVADAAVRETSLVNDAVNEPQPDVYTHKDAIPWEDDIEIDELPEPEIKEETVETQPEAEESFEIDFDTEDLVIEDKSIAKTQPDDDLTLELESQPEEIIPPVTEPLKTGEGIISDNTANEALQKYGPYDPTLDLPKYKIPPLDLLVEHGSGSDEIKMDREELETNKNRIVETLRNYGIEIARIKATIGPTVTLYEIVPAAGVRISKIKNLEDDIALSLAALGIRIIAPIPGKGTIGIEVPNQNPEIVSMRSLLASDKFQSTKFDLPIALGKTISNEIFIADLAKMPHLLMAGATGQGKSVGLNSILVSLLYKKHPAEIKFVLVDPKKVELTLYNLIEKHFLAKLPGEEDAIITDTKKVVSTLNSLCIEMDNRYELLKNAQVRNLKEYNAKFTDRKLNPMDGHRFLPYIVVVIDEFADFIMTAGKEVETPIARIAQLARAIGIHLIIATQRPSVNIITGSIKANFPARIAFRVASKIDSRTILDSGGADQLIGRGDMLLSTGSDLIRLQCAFVDTPEVEAIAKFIGAQQGYAEALKLPEYVGEEGDPDKTRLEMGDKDDLFEEAATIVVNHQQGSASLLQRRLNLGYNRAGRLIDQLESAGIVGPNKGSKAREVLIQDLEQLKALLNRI